MTSINNMNKKFDKDNSILFFCGKWCSSCKTLAPKLEHIESKIDGLKIYKADIEENEDLANEYNILALPTLIFFKNGEMISCTSHAMQEERIMEIIENGR